MQVRILPRAPKSVAGEERRSARRSHKPEPETGWSSTLPSATGDRVCRHDAALSAQRAGFDSRYHRQSFVALVNGRGHPSGDRIVEVCWRRKPVARVRFTLSRPSGSRVRVSAPALGAGRLCSSHSFPTISPASSNGKTLALYASQDPRLMSAVCWFDSNRRHQFLLYFAAVGSRQSGCFIAS